MTGRERRPPSGRAAPMHLRWAVVATAVMAALASAIPALPAAALGTGGANPFGLTVAPDGHGHVAPYFKLTLRGGHSATGTALISNRGTKTEKLKISPSIGVTATNGGSGYARAFQKCTGAACWVTGLPRLVTLPAGTGRRLPFTVRVPRGTKNGQYLAGISAELAARPHPVQVGGNGKATAQAIIVERVTVGVAVTVGTLSQLTTRLRIPHVSGQSIGRIARLNIQLVNSGQTFAGATGSASCTAAARRHVARVFAGTVLPHQRAVIPVNVPGMRQGITAPCRVQLHYGQGQTARWAGSITLPDPPKTKLVHTGNGTYSVVPVAKSPTMAIVLAAVGGLVAAGLIALLVVMLRRRRASSAF